VGVLVFILLFWVLPFPVAIKLGRQKGRKGWPWALLGWVGVLCLVIMSDDMARSEETALAGGQKRCPYCKELVKIEASICKHCNQSLDVRSGITPSFSPTQATASALRDAPAPGGSPVSSVAQEFEKLGKLRADGVITDEEFATAKAKLL